MLKTDLWKCKAIARISMGNVWKRHGKWGPLEHARGLSASAVGGYAWLCCQNTVLAVGFRPDGAHSLSVWTVGRRSSLTVQHETSCSPKSSTKGRSVVQQGSLLGLGIYLEIKRYIYGYLGPASQFYPGLSILH